MSKNAKGGSGKLVCHKNTAWSEIEVFCWKCKIKNLWKTLRGKCSA